MALFSYFSKFNFNIMAMITERQPNIINGNENPPREYKVDPITGPHK